MRLISGPEKKLKSALALVRSKGGKSLPELENALLDPKSSVGKVVVVIDIKDSTAMKEELRPTWLGAYAVLYKEVARTIAPYGGTIVKYVGDGAMAVFDEGKTVDAMNWAITVQENLDHARYQKLIGCWTSIGISRGKMIEFDSPNGGKDYVGEVVDRAFRLCSEGNPGAILADGQSVDGADLHLIKSAAGHQSRRVGRDYVRGLPMLKLKGFREPVECAEILYGNSEFGAKSAGLSASQRITSTSPTSEPTNGGESSEESAWVMGSVVTIGPTAGFIRANGEDFWFHPQQPYFFRSNLKPEPRHEAWFKPLPPFPNKTNRRASEILPMGATLSGRLTYVNARGFGSVACTKESGEKESFFIYLRDSTGWSPGDEVEFEVGDNAKGIAMVNPREPNAKRLDVQLRPGIEQSTDKGFLGRMFGRSPR